ncbi:MAG: hypothetical protein OES57_13630 [Acidimicrobiia bacterium]|nr:hypothetical protein [Acidimicrobiia bacterium]
MLRAFVIVQSALVSRSVRASQRGQATVEYVLIMLGAAAVALLVLAWATGSGKVAALLDAVIDSITGQV